MELNSFIIVAIIGLIAGILGGLFGIGGAIIIIPALVLLMGYSQQNAQGTTLMMMVLPVGALAAYQYYQKGFVDIKVSLIMAVFFLVGGFIGAKFATQFPEELLKKVFSVLLFVVAIKMWIQK